MGSSLQPSERRFAWRVYRHRAAFCVAAGFVSGFVLVPSLMAQDDPPLVDRAVADLDPLATSTRYLDPAYANNPNRERVTLLRPADPAAGVGAVYNLEGPGYRATFNRPDYLVQTQFGPALNHAGLRDGAYVDVIPPNTVFDLTPPRPTQPLAPLSPEAQRLVVDTRIGGDAQPSFFSPVPTLTPMSFTIPDVGADGQPVQLQPWVTAEDLRQPSGLDPVASPELTPNTSGLTLPNAATVVPEVPAQAPVEDAKAINATRSDTPPVPTATD